jgi:hypothetical protein
MKGSRRARRAMMGAGSLRVVLDRNTLSCQEGMRGTKAEGRGVGDRAGRSGARFCTSKSMGSGLEGGEPGAEG